MGSCLLRQLHRSDNTAARSHVDVLWQHVCSLVVSTLWGFKNKVFWVLFDVFAVSHTSCGVLQTCVGGFRTSLGVCQTRVGGFRTSLGVCQMRVGVFQTCFGVVQTSFGVVQTSLGVFQTSFGIFQTSFGVFQTPWGRNHNGKPLIWNIPADELSDSSPVTRR